MSAAEVFFVDTNVLLYSVDPRDAAKHALARRWLDGLWSRGVGRISWQVLHEFYVNAVRKLSRPASEAGILVSSFAQWVPVDTTLGLIERAWHWMDSAQVSYWDALIVAAAERAGCRMLLSEDFQAGRTFGSITVIDPFQPDALAALRD